jgi:hypothetical protein
LLIISVVTMFRVKRSWGFETSFAVGGFWKELRRRCYECMRSRETRRASLLGRAGKLGALSTRAGVSALLETGFFQRNLVSDAPPMSKELVAACLPALISRASPVGSLAGRWGKLVDGHRRTGCPGWVTCAALCVYAKGKRLLRRCLL